MAELLEALKPHIGEIVGGLVLLIMALIGGATILATKFFKVSADLQDLKLKSEAAQADLKIQIDKVNLDDTEREKKIEARWKELIQLTYQEQANDLRNQRNMIDTLNSQVAVAEAEGTKKDAIIKDLQRQIAEGDLRQKTNIERISALEKAAAERDSLKAQVDELTKKVTELESKRDIRHAEMSQMSATNQQQYLEIQRLTAERDKAQQSLDDCNGQLTAKLAEAAVSGPQETNQPQGVNKTEES